MGSTFLLLLQPTAPRNFFFSSELYKEKTKTFLMRILQRRVWLPTLITSYWDHDRLQAQLASATALLYSLHSIPHPRTACCLSVSSLRGWAASECYCLPTSPRRKWDCPQIVWQTTISFWGNIDGEWMCA